ncbi:MAG: methylenetetrahydrofolate reductase C-terminal domain-containing protein [Deltaproteobacteria bacterium]|nr:methylenetetrahydrofolate reductase C-terminal domain-containing protein [Deltaproteobacteria bacterium]
MIVTTLKPLDEILESISPYRKILIAGCDGCTQPPRGLREAKTLKQLLELAGQLKGKKFDFKVTSVVKQCDSVLTTSALKPYVEDVEAVLSLACGAGPQTVAEFFPDLPVIPAQNSHFIGIDDREGSIMYDSCTACGDCILALTGGICPVTRCSKGLLSGACGGASNGKCELDSERDCAWELIYERLKRLGKLDLIRELAPPKDYSAKGWRVTP